AVLATQQAPRQEYDEPQAGAVDAGAELCRVDPADEVVVFGVGRRVLEVALVHLEVRRTGTRRRVLRDEMVVATEGRKFDVGHDHITSWKVRLMTSSCCSRVSLMKLTA